MSYRPPCCIGYEKRSYVSASQASVVFCLGRPPHSMQCKRMKYKSKAARMSDLLSICDRVWADERCLLRPLHLSRRRHCYYSHPATARPPARPASPVGSVGLLISPFGST